MNTQTKMLFVDIFCQLCKNESLFAKRVSVFVNMTQLFAI